MVSFKKMKYHNPNSEHQRDGFNALSFFFFGKIEEAGWKGITTKTGIDAIDLVIFTTLFVEQKIFPPDKSPGVKYHTMLTILRAFAEYEKQYPGRDNNGPWLNMDFDGNSCSGNRKYAVLLCKDDGNAMKKVPSEIVFSMFNRHWTIQYSQTGEAGTGAGGATSEDFSIRFEFFINLFIMCVSSMKTYNAVNYFVLSNIGISLVAHSKETYDGTGILTYVWEIYKWVSDNKRDLNINVSEVTQLLVNYGMIRPIIESNFWSGISYSIIDNVYIFSDKRFQKIMENWDDKRNFDNVFGQMAKGYTNFFTHDTTHRALYSREIDNLSPDDFVIEMFKRTTGMKTLLTQNGFLDFRPMFKGVASENTKKRFEPRDNVLEGKSGHEPDPIATELEKGEWNTIDGVLNKYLTPFAYSDCDSYMTIALGIASFKKARRAPPCSLAHLKFSLLVVLRWLHNNDIADSAGIIAEANSNPLTNLNDEEFFNFLIKANSIVLPDVSGLKGIDTVFETLVTYGFFEIASKFRGVGNVKVGFKRMTGGSSQPVESGRNLTSLGDLLRIITSDSITVEL